MPNLKLFYQGRPASSPWYSIGMIFLGIGIATVWANLTRDDLYIAVGGELILLSLGSLLITNHLGLLARSLLALGISLPFFFATLAPLYYSQARWFISKGFWSMFGLGTIPGMVVFFLGVYLFTQINKQRSFSSQQEPTWLGWVDVLFRLGGLITVSTMAIKQWNEFTLTMVYLGIALFVLGLLVIIPYRITMGLRASGRVLMILGLGGGLVTFVAWYWGEGRVSNEEALVGLIPSLVVGGIGLLLGLFSPKTNKE